MPAPAENAYEDRQWRIVQRQAEWHSELCPIATALANNVGNPLDKAAILSPAGIGNPVQQWSDYWGTILSQFGLFFPDDSAIPVVQPTRLCFDISAGKLNESTFYLLWILAFQMPYAMKKHAAWYSENRQLQPGVVLLRVLRELSQLQVKRGKDPEVPNSVYLTAEEVLHFLMAPLATDVSIYTLREQAALIDAARSDPALTPTGLTGFETVVTQIRGRFFPLLKKTGLFLDASNLSLNLEGLRRSERLLSYASAPVVYEGDKETYRQKLKDRFDAVSLIADQVSRI